MPSWLTDNWFDLFQTLGVVVSLCYAGKSYLLDKNLRRTEILLSLTEAHRSIWERLIDQPELGRILEPAVDTSVSPPSLAEERFVKLVLLHVAAVQRATADGFFHSPPELDEDVRTFLSLPIPRFVLGTFLPYQGREFREYLEFLLK